MLRLPLLDAGGARRVFVLGAHADDIEIGCGGTLLRILEARDDVEVTWVVLTSTAAREREATASAEAFLAGAKRKQVVVKKHRDGFLPYSGAAVKDDFESLKAFGSPDLVLTHYRNDRHQDHRLVSDLTWNTWRNNLILEYEIPKWDGDFGSPNVFAPLSAETLERKIDLLLRAFPSQAGKSWFSPDLFRAVARIRGMECGAPGGLAEAFYARKAVI
jgi:LmbE family N-acetylglucosaminyl deacetylase